VAKYRLLLEDEQVRRWYRSVARGSPLTAKVWLRQLCRLSELLRMTPREMVEHARRDLSGLQDRLEDVVSRLEDEGKAPGYIALLVATAKSWLRHNDVVLTRKIKAAGASRSPRTENERVPTQEELARLLRVASPRVRVAIALIAFSGLRLQVLGNHDGSDGLMLRDLPELKVKNGKVEFEKTPAMIVVRPTLSKAKHRYFTFLSAEGCTYLKEYLEQRIRAGEVLTPASPVMAHEKGRDRRGRFLVTDKVSYLIREAMRKAGVMGRPYVLRAYFDTNMIIAESRGRISHPYLQFFMGHRGDIEARYSTNKGVLPPDMIEDMRKCYRECEPFISTFAQQAEQSSIVKESKIEVLKSLAKTLLGIDLLDVKIARERELGRKLSMDEELELFENELKKLREGTHNPQRIVKEDELEQYLSRGWQFVAVLPSQRVLVRKS
jgi:hypothetical protein